MEEGDRVQIINTRMQTMSDNWLKIGKVESVMLKTNKKGIERSSGQETRKSTW